MWRCKKCKTISNGINVTDGYCSFCDECLLLERFDSLNDNEKNIPERLEIHYWKSIGRELFGDNFDKWIFQCPSCNHKQSVNQVIEHNPKLNKEEIRKWIHFNCEGIIDEEHGCKHSLGGFITFEELLIINKREENASFIFAKQEA